MHAHKSQKLEMLKSDQISWVFFLGKKGFNIFKDYQRKYRKCFKMRLITKCIDENG